MDMTIISAAAYSGLSNSKHSAVSGSLAFSMGKRNDLEQIAEDIILTLEREDSATILLNGVHPDNVYAL